MKRIVFMVCVMLLAVSETYGQLQTEYFFDIDPGYGKATQETSKTGENIFTLQTSQLDAGMHLLGIRSVDANGQWSPTITSPIYVFDPETDVSSAEWFIDTDPGFGNATRVTTAAGSNVITIPTKSISAGMHLLGIRSCSKSGQWSSTLTSPLYVTEPMDVARAEWFVDTDPGEGEANNIDINNTKETAFIVPTSELTEGDHSLTVRIMTTTGDWLPYAVTPFTVTMDTGIAEVKSIMSVDIHRTAEKIILTRCDNMNDANAEIFTVDGTKRDSSIWPTGEQTLNFNIPQQLSPVIVVVKKMNGTRFVKLIK